MSGLPPLTGARRTVAAALTAELVRRIAAAGPLPFEAYMDSALYHPQWGYYMNPLPKFGADGDFVTAPESGPLFGRLLAEHCRRWAAELGGADLIELGAGSGALAEQLLAALDAAGALPARYGIVEPSPALRALQKARAAAWPARWRARLCWFEAPPAEPWRAVVIANEVLDALPVARFVVGEDGRCRAEYVDWDAAAGRLRRVDGPPPPALAEALAALARSLPEPLPAGYRSEIALRLDGWFARLAAALEAGLVLLLDYGYPRAEYYHPQRAAGTLRCHLAHRAHDDPLWAPGAQDMGAHVDFSAAAAAAAAAGFTVAGFCTQADLLLGAGPAALEAALAAAPAERLRLAAQLKQLSWPGGMGETVKALALVRNWPGPVPRLPADRRVRL
ncbi:MAG: SAM-dependent methyltransferase [Gammaproteobacteria bacterium]|nr:MAG: SAM-dependent methyltransferase [Gammaproteobacteria bacterium]